MRVEIKIRSNNGENRIEADLEGGLSEMVETVDNLLADMAKLQSSQRVDERLSNKNPFIKPEYQENRECTSCRSHWFFWFSKELSGRVGSYPGIAYVFCANCGKPHPIQ